jgi:benzodiazapine receptor
MCMVRSPKRLTISLGLPFLAGVIGSLATFPAIPIWYAGLVKPDFVPPNWIFGPVWTLLYILMGLSLYIVWMKKDKRSKQIAFTLFGFQLFLNSAWSVVFFGLHQPLVAVGVVIALLITIILNIVAFWPFSRRASYLLIPYALWVGFASALTISIAILNPSPSGVSSYEECIRASGSTILTMYPSVCMTREGQRFAESSQSVAQDQLKIREWGLVVPLNDAIGDAYYTYDKDQDKIFLSTTQLESLRRQVHGCTSGLHGIYYKHEGAQLLEQPLIETLCLPASTDATRQIQQLQSQLRAAAKSAEVSK